MKKSAISYISPILFLLFSVLIGFKNHSPALAQTITETTKLNCGYMSYPSSPPASITIATDDTYTESGTTVIGGTVRAGDFLLQAGGSGTITINVTSGGYVTGLAVDTFTGKYDGASITFPAAGLAWPSTGGKVLTIGARCHIRTSGLTEGTKSPPFTIDVTAP